MTIAVDAVYQNVVFRPTTPPDLPEGTAVRLTVEPAPPAAPPTDGPSAYAILTAITARSVKPGPPETTSRDHDKVLYGERGDPGDVC